MSDVSANPAGRQGGEQGGQQGGEQGGEPVLVLVRDLLMQSRVTGAAKRLGVPVRVVRDPVALTETTPGRLAVVDLDLDGAVEAATAWGRAAGRPVAGFVQHVHAERIRLARAAGVNPIVPRSRLDAALPELLSRTV